MDIDAMIIDSENDLENSSSSSNKRKDFQGNGNLFYRYLLSQILGDQGNPQSVVCMEIRLGGVSRTEAENITYGQPIDINAQNINSLGLGNDIVTYFMDENGNLSVDDELLDLGSDFSEVSPEDFLAKFASNGDGRHSCITSPDGQTFVTGHEDESFKLQRVEVDGTTQGYFIYNDDGFNKTGFYLDSNAIDFSSLNDDLKYALMKSEPAIGMENGLENRVNTPKFSNSQSFPSPVMSMISD